MTEEELDEMARSLIPRLSAIAYASQYDAPKEQVNVARYVHCEVCGRRASAHRITDNCLRQAG